MASWRFALRVHVCAVWLFACMVRKGKCCVLAPSGCSILLIVGYAVHHRYVTNGVILFEHSQVHTAQLVPTNCSQCWLAYCMHVQPALIHAIG